MGTGRGAVSHKRVPCLRGLDWELRAKRCRAARKYAVGALPRYAILMGHWDHGSIVKGATDGNEAKPRKE